MNCSSNFIKNVCNNNNNMICKMKCNIDILNKEYSKNLKLYREEYNKFLEFKFDKGPDKNRKNKIANTINKKKLNNINNNLEKLLNNIKIYINEINNNIKTQKNMIGLKNSNIYRQNMRLKNNDENILKENENLLKKERQIDTGVERNNYKRNIMYFLIIVNIILFIGIGKLIIQNKK